MFDIEAEFNLCYRDRTKGSLQISETSEYSSSLRQDRLKFKQKFLESAVSGKLVKVVFIQEEQRGKIRRKNVLVIRTKKETMTIL